MDEITCYEYCAWAENVWYLKYGKTIENIVDQYFYKI